MGAEEYLRVEEYSAEEYFPGRKNIFEEYLEEFLEEFLDEFPRRIFRAALYCKIQQVGGLKYSSKYSSRNSSPYSSPCFGRLIRAVLDKFGAEEYLGRKNI